LCLHLAQKRTLVDVVHERALALDLDHRQPLAVARLELRIAGDVDLLEVEGMGLPNLCERAPGTLAEVAVLGVVEDDPRYG
jgi:hypothetical protein